MTGNTHPHRSRRTKTVRLTPGEIEALLWLLNAMWDSWATTSRASNLGSIHGKIAGIA